MMMAVSSSSTGQSPTIQTPDQTRKSYHRRAPLRGNGRRNPQKHLQTGRAKAMREYAVIFEKTSTGWSAYVPDLPGLGVAGPTYETTEQLIREGINFHIEGLRADGDPIPEPTTRVAKLPISA